MALQPVGAAKNARSYSTTWSIGSALRGSAASRMRPRSIRQPFARRITL